MPNGIFFTPVVFFGSSSAQRGSLYVPTGGDTSFAWQNLWRTQINGIQTQKNRRWEEFEENEKWPRFPTDRHCKVKKKLKWSAERYSECIWFLCAAAERWASPVTWRYVHFACFISPASEQEVVGAWSWGLCSGEADKRLSDHGKRTASAGGEEILSEARDVRRRSVWQCVPLLLFITQDWMYLNSQWVSFRSDGWRDDHQVFINEKHQIKPEPWLFGLSQNPPARTDGRLLLACSGWQNEFKYGINSIYQDFADYYWPTVYTWESAECNNHLYIWLYFELSLVYVISCSTAAFMVGAYNTHTYLWGWATKGLVLSSSLEMP